MDWQQTHIDVSTELADELRFLEESSAAHYKGDICLRIVAQKIHQVIVRPLDLVARLGGEEFAIVRTSQ